MPDDHAEHGSGMWVDVPPVTGQRQSNIQEVEHKRADVSDCKVVDEFTELGPSTEQFRLVDQEDMLGDYVHQR